MRQSRLFAQTYREAPSEADAVSHRLLLRAGFIRQIAAGVYAYLPLGLKVLRRLECILVGKLAGQGEIELKFRDRPDKETASIDEGYARAAAFVRDGRGTEVDRRDGLR